MRKELAIILMFVNLSSANSQITTTYYDDSALRDSVVESFLKVIHSSVVQSKKIIIPKLDVSQLLREDKGKEGLAVPYRFGKGIDQNLTLNDGNWVEMDDGRLWSLAFEADSAQSLNFIFKDFHLPDEGKLYIVNHNGTVVYGPVTPNTINNEGHFLTDVIPDSKVTVLLYEPSFSRGLSSLTISKTVYGYRAAMVDQNDGLIRSSESCNNDIACFPEFQKEAKAVAKVLDSNGESCFSGSLMMSTNMDYKGYFLTAFHCIDINGDGILSVAEKANTQNWMFKFNYRKTSCEGNNVTSGYSYNGSTFRAAYYPTDFALVEINQTIPQNGLYSWLGWDRTGNVPSSGTCIHHPSGDVMKISIDDDPLSSSTFAGYSNNHWTTNFDDGVVEHGSSGSPLLNSDKKVVGQLHDNFDWIGILTYCSQPRGDFGKISLSWPGGGSNSTRLSDWLDPNGWGITVMPGSADLIISGDEYLYKTGIYSLSSLPSGMSVNWSLTGDNAASYIIEANTPSTNQCKITQKTDVDINGSASLTLSAQIMYGGSVFYTTSKELTGHYIAGPMVPCGTTFYYVNPLPANHTVEWEADGQNLEYDNVQSGTIPENLYPYVIDHQQNERHYGTLTATVKLGNTVVGTLVKQIDTAGGFSGTWYQQPSLTDSTNAVPQTFSHQSSLPVVPNRMVYLVSDDFANSTITHSGNGLFLMYWYNSNGVISFIPVPPVNTPPGQLLFENINGISADGCRSFSFRIIRAPQLSLPFTLSATLSEGSCQFTLGADEEAMASADERLEISTEWHLTVTRSDTGSVVHESSISGSSKTIGTSGWEIFLLVVQILCTFATAFP